MNMAFRPIIFAALFMAEIGRAYGDNSMVFSTIEGANITKTIIPILKRAYGELGIDAKFKFYPAPRGVMVSNSGLYDGETFRGMDFIKEETNLLPVMVVIGDVDWRVYSKKTQFKVQGFKSLAPYSVSSRRGILAADNILQFARVKHMLNTFEQSLLMLDAGRVDLAIIPERVARPLLEKTPLDVFSLSPSIRVDKLYHFLHKKHKNLIPKITEVLKKMEQNGDINRIWDDSDAQ